MPGWQQVGSGFSGIDKYTNVNRILTLRNSPEETDDEIIVEKTPEFKKKCSRERKRSNLQTNTLKSETSKLWKPENLQAAFETCANTGKVFIHLIVFRKTVISSIGHTSKILMPFRDKIKYYVDLCNFVSELH